MNNIQNLLDNVKNIHFIGIGGSGMCPMVGILLHNGYHISGSDNYISDTLQRIIDRGIKVYTQHDAKNIENAELVVYSAAIKEDNVENRRYPQRYSMHRALSYARTFMR